VFWKRKLAPFIREAETSDLDAIEKSHASGFARGWSNGEIQSLLQSDSVFCLVLLEEGKTHKSALGFVMVRSAADEAEILSIAVDPVHRRRGVGKHLVQAAIRRLQADRVASLFLEVAETNTGAVTLYKKLGFKQVGIRENYYAPAAGGETAVVSSAESALVMRLDLI